MGEVYHHINGCGDSGNVTQPDYRCTLYEVMAVVRLLQRLIRKSACMKGGLADNLPCVPLVDKGGHHNGLHACFLWTLGLHILYESAAGMESCRNEIHCKLEFWNGH
jgi:hypothetical protein